MVDLDALKSWLFVPALQEKFVRGAVASAADAFILDLEDSVPAGRKDDARALLVPMAAGLSSADRPVFVRINRANSTDLAACATIALSGIVVPKAETAQEMVEARAIFTRCGGSDDVVFVAAIESALGILNARELAESNDVAALMFGTGDFVAETGFAIVPEALTAPASLISIAAKAFGKPAFGVAASIAELNDLDAFSGWCAHARSIGYSGTPVIHPKQVEAAKAGFSPTATEVARARSVVEAYEASGGGASAAGGRLIERPVYIHALTTLRRVRTDALGSDNSKTETA